MKIKMEIEKKTCDDTVKVHERKVDDIQSDDLEYYCLVANKVEGIDQNGDKCPGLLIFVPDVVEDQMFRRKSDC
jgi:hypothetical protein